MTDIVNLATLFQIPRVTVQHGDSVKRIQATTNRAQQLVEALVDILDERALALSTTAQFTLALQDAHLMHTMMPMSSKGYLRAIQIYHDQGRQSSAIALCHEALVTVPRSDTAYDQLALWKDMVEQANCNVVDFISNLPLDVVTTHIVPRVLDSVLGSNTACPYLYVSRTWRERFLLHPDGLEFMMEYKKPLSLEQGHDQLIRFAPFTGSLSVGHCKGSNNNRNKLSDLFSRVNFQSLTHLELSNTFAMDRVAFLAALESVSCTLTHFELKSSLSQTRPLPIVLHDLLDTCPKLVSLVVRGIKAEMSCTSQYPEMKHLSLFRLPTESITYDAMQQVFSRFPSLVTLDVGPMPDSRILPVVHDYCPLIQQLSFGSSSSMNKSTFTYNGKGLQQLAIGFAPQSMCRQEDVVSMLLQHKYSLQSFRLAGNIATGNHEILEHTPTFMQLEELDFRYASNSCMDILLWMMHQAPNLKHIQLWHGANENQHILRAMTQLKHLRRVCIQMINMERPVLPEFIQHHVNLGIKSSLASVRIVCNGEAGDSSSLIPITRLQRLRSLEIFSHGIIPGSYKLLMSHIAKQSPSLEELKLLSTMADIDSSILEPLQSHPGLKRLMIFGSDLSQEDLLYLTSVPKLEYFETWSKISNVVLELLEKKIPIIKCESIQ